MSSRVVVLVEGKTELNFVRQVLAPVIGLSGVYLHPQPGGKPGARVAGAHYSRIHREILAILKQNTTQYCTTMYDYYALPDDWPGRVEASHASTTEKPAIIEKAVHRDICDRMGNDFNLRRFVPYIQMHEFEALLFSDVSILAREAEIEESRLLNIVDSFSTPEEIDDSPKTAPSKRLLALNGHYGKTLTGIAVAKRVGLDRIRKKCPHFNKWVGKLEQLGKT